MSNIGSKIEKLITEGFSYNTLRGLSESQVNLLYNRLVEARPFQTTGMEYTPDEVKQMAQKGLAMPGGKEVKPTQQGGLIVTNEDTEMDVEDPSAGEITQTPHQKMAPDGMDDDSDKELNERFESKRQQKYFWWKCNSSKSERAKEKWCKWAKEFSDKTNFKKLPEKAESVKKLEESLTKLVEKYIPESISKKDLMELIESSTRTKEAPDRTKEKEKEKEKEKKKPGNPFKIEPSQKPGPKGAGEAAPKEKEKTKEKEKPKTKNPFRIKPEQKPGPKGELGEAGSAAPAKAPERTKEKEKEKEKPSRKNPFKIEPAQKPGPKGRVPKWLSFDTFTKLGYNLK
jgi:hypothetical protein